MRLTVNLAACYHGSDWIGHIGEHGQRHGSASILLVLWVMTQMPVPLNGTVFIALHRTAACHFRGENP